MVSLNDKVVIITGASSGIGKAAALEFAKHQCSLVLAARRAERLQQLTEKITTFNPDCDYCKADVTNEDDVIKLFEHAVDRFGKVDILINNAGRGLKSTLADMSSKDWHSVIETNLTSVFLCTRQAVITMTNQKTKGHIITVNSIAGRFGAPTYSAYCASKHGVTGFNKALKWELRKKGIKVSSIYPARIDTEFFDIYEIKPGKRQMLSPQDIANDILAIAQRNPAKILAVRTSNFAKRLSNLIRPIS